MVLVVSIYLNLILLQSTKIIESCYLSEWYQLSKTSQKSLMLLMERAKRPLVIELYSLIYISLDTLAVVRPVMYLKQYLLNIKYILDNQVGVFSCCFNKGKLQLTLLLLTSFLKANDSSTKLYYTCPGNLLFSNKKKFTTLYIYVLCVFFIK